MEEREREGGRERGMRKRGNNYGDSPAINSILYYYLRIKSIYINGKYIYIYNNYTEQ